MGDAASDPWLATAAPRPESCGKTWSGTINAVKAISTGHRNWMGDRNKNTPGSGAELTKEHIT
jgi:hypothetical protein